MESDNSALGAGERRPVELAVRAPRACSRQEAAAAAGRPPKCAMGCGGHPEDTDSELDEAGPASAGGAGSRCAVAPPDPSAAPAFAQVRALLWRREWMQSQIALLSQQRDQLAKSLAQVEDAKTPILLSAAPHKRKRLQDTPAEPVTASNAQASGHAAISGGRGAANAGGSHAPSLTQDGAEPGGAEAAVGCGCVREVDWEQVLQGRRRKLVQASLSLETLAALQAESKRRLRTQLPGLNGARDGSYSLGRERPKTQHEVAAARAKMASQQQQGNLVAEVKGNVTNGGRKIVTSSGQKLIIKFSAKAPQQPSPRTPASRGPGIADTPISGQKKHRAVLQLSDSKMQRSGDSPRMRPSQTPAGTPRDREKQEWGLDEYVYGGPRTHAKIETVEVKEIAVPSFRIIHDYDVDHKSGESLARQSRSLSVGSRYAKAKPMRSNGHAGDDSSEEDTDDEVYLSRHRPFEEQEVRFRSAFRSLCPPTQPLPVIAC